MKNIDIAKLLYEMKPGDPPSLHMGTKWYTMWNSHTVEEAWQEAESIIPDWEHDWNALKELLTKVMEENEFTLSVEYIEGDFDAELYNPSLNFSDWGDTLEKAILRVIYKALTISR